jgi:small subunit ribosomal protein S5
MADETAPAPIAAAEAPAPAPAPAPEVRNDRNDRNDRGRGRGPRQNRRRDDDGKDKPFVPGTDIMEKTVFINRCAKVVKGGRRFSFSALIVVGDKAGRVGFGFGKANEVSEAIRKASDHGRKNLQPVALQNNTIPHAVEGNHGGGYVILKPASPGTGIKAGGAVRAVCDAVGIKDIIGKSLGSSNHANVLKATLDALGQLRQRADIFKARGITVKPAAAK